MMIYTVAQAALPSRPDPLAPAEPEAALTSPSPPAAPPAKMVSAFAYAEPAPGHPVISPFGLRQLPWEEHGRLHAGVDIAAPAGEPVRATAHGVVARAGRDGAYGRFVELRHAGGVRSFYAHLGAIDRSIKPGVAVMQGAPVGQIGDTGSSTGAHLHFEIRDRKGRPLNPEMFLGEQFASADALPLTAAGRFPRRVRVAYVSNIPRSKRELMAAREAEKAEMKAGLMKARFERIEARSPAAAEQIAGGKPAPVFLDLPPAPSAPAGRVHATLQTSG